VGGRKEEWGRENGGGEVKKNKTTGAGKEGEEGQQRAQGLGGESHAIAAREGGRGRRKKKGRNREIKRGKSGRDQIQGGTLSKEKVKGGRV